MFVKIYLAAMGLIALIALFNPLRGIYCLLLLFLCNPGEFIAEKIEQFRPIFIIGGILFLRTLVSILNPVIKRQTWFTVLIFLFIFCAILSYIFSGKLEIWQSVQIANYVKAGLLSIVLVSFIKEKHELTTIIRLLVLAAALNGIFAIYEQFNPIAERLAESPGYYRSSGFLANANRFSATILSIFPFAFYMFNTEKSKLLRFLGLAALVLSVIGIFYSISRGGLLTLIFVIGLISWKQSRNIKTYLILALIAFCFIFIGAQFYQQRETVRKARSGEIKFDASTTMRLHLMGVSLNLWVRNPLFGVGPNNFVEQAIEQLGERKQALSRSVHNAYLHLLAEQGIIGFGLFVAIVSLSLKAAAFLKQKTEEYRDIAGYFQICIASWLFSFLASTAQVDPVMWACLTFPVILEKIYHLNVQAETQRV